MFYAPRIKPVLAIIGNRPNRLGIHLCIPRLVASAWIYLISVMPITRPGLNCADCAGTAKAPEVLEASNPSPIASVQRALQLASADHFD
jgi:hypothetical protein